MRHAEVMADERLRPGTRFCQCGACGAYFTNDGNFLKHRTGDADHRRCLTPAQLRHKGLLLNDRGYWQGPGREVSE